MNKLFWGFVLFLCALLVPTFRVRSGPLPPYPFSRSSKQMDGSELRNKALKLFEYSRRENPRLSWNACLARKANQRARQLVERGYFDHKDPLTGQNPAWNMVVECQRFRFAGENLAKGSEPAETIHGAWMKSPTHKRNILDPRYSVLGVGCYSDVCVELFAGGRSY